MSQPRGGLMRRLLYRLTDRLPCRIINGDDGQPYLERYHLCALPFGGRAYIHRFVASDPDRGLHDHPWPWALGMVLSGGYQEEREATPGTGTAIRLRALGPASMNLIRGDDFHRIVLPEASEAWTFFAHGRKVKNWGFLVSSSDGKRRFRPHEDREPTSHRNWWEHAPAGREVRRATAQN